MSAMKNLFHGAVLLVWGVLGVAVTLKFLLGGGPVLAGLAMAAGYWLWFLGLAAVTSAAVARFTTVTGAVVVHGLALVVMSLVPHGAPLSVLRIGLDLIVHA